jgi:hypothetical protein
MDPLARGQGAAVRMTRPNKFLDTDSLAWAARSFATVPTRRAVYRGQ